MDDLMLAQLLAAWLQAEGRKVLVAQLSDIYRPPPEDDKDYIQRRQLLTCHLDLSAARILHLGGLRVPPQKVVLWLEQRGAPPGWGLLSPGIVVLVAVEAQVCKEVI
jgi:hypothetical protein